MREQQILTVLEGRSARRGYDLMRSVTERLATLGEIRAESLKNIKRHLSDLDLTKEDAAMESAERIMKRLTRGPSDSITPVALRNAIGPEETTRVIQHFDEVDYDFRASLL